MPAKKHIHMYYRGYLGSGKGKKIKKEDRTEVWKCRDPKCSHYTYAQLITGKYSLCNKCGEQFILPRAKSLLDSYPVCRKCAILRKKNVPRVNMPKINKVESASPNPENPESILYKEAYLGHPDAIDTLLKRAFTEEPSNEEEEK
jgi:acetyl-CoA carboxylase beta subunit